MRRRGCRIRRLALAGALLAGFAEGVPGQSLPDRLALEHLPDSLSSVEDTVVLGREYRALARAERDSRNAPVQLRLGLVALRLAELGVDRDAREAIRRLRRVVDHEPGWALAWYALGLAEAVRAGWEQANRLALGSRVGLGTLERAAGRLHRALESDPAYAPAALALAELTLDLRDTARFPPARDAIRHAVSLSPSPPAELLLAWGRIERAAGDLDSADAAFIRGGAVGGAPGLILLERARTGLAAGWAPAESLYFAGAAVDDPRSVAGYREDLAPIAERGQLAHLDRLRGTARAEYLRRFWTDRDRYEMRAHGERLREHFRRLLHARRGFPLTISRRFYGAADAYRSGSEELDDRGVIYVRHGEPAERLRPFVFGLMPNESWRYARAEGDLVFHFSSGYDENGGGDLYDYRLVESVLDLRGASGAPVDQLLLSRQSLSPLYGRMLNWGTFGAARSRARERGMGQTSIAVGTSTDTYELQFARPLAAVADLIAVGSRSGGSLAHFVFALEDTGAAALEAGSGGRYATRVRVVAFPEDGSPPVAIDTTLEVQAGRPRGEDRYLLGRAELELPSGRWAWRAALAVGDSAGVVFPGDTVLVGGDSRLELSDLALGAPGTSARWHPLPADTVLLTPFDLFRAGGEVRLYYEAAGAAPPASYRHEIAVYRMKGDAGAPDRRPIVSLAFEEPAGSATLRSHRTLQLGQLKPGRYLVEVRLTAPEGTTSVRRREFRVVKPR